MFSWLKNHPGAVERKKSGVVRWEGGRAIKEKGVEDPRVSQWQAR